MGSDTVTHGHTHTVMNIHNFKVVLLGEGCVGKTSTVLRFVENKFVPKHLSTLQAAFINKKVTVDGKQVNLSIWDTAGQERFHALGPIYYRDSQGAILVYDITDEDSFRKVQTWVKELKKMLGSDICLVIAGNKVDLEKKRNVDRRTAEQYADSVGAAHIHTSAKLNQGIEEVFQTISQRMIERAESKIPLEAARYSGRNRTPVYILDDSDPPPPPRPGCCGSSQ